MKKSTLEKLIEQVLMEESLEWKSPSGNIINAESLRDAKNLRELFKAAEKEGIHTNLAALDGYVNGTQIQSLKQKYTAKIASNPVDAEKKIKLALQKFFEDFQDWAKSKGLNKQNAFTSDFFKDSSNDGKDYPLNFERSVTDFGDEIKDLRGLDVDDDLTKAVERLPDEAQEIWANLFTDQEINILKPLYPKAPAVTENVNVDKTFHVGDLQVALNTKPQPVPVFAKIKQFYNQIKSSNLSAQDKQLTFDFIKRLLVVTRGSDQATATKGVSSGYGLTSKSASEGEKIDVQVVQAFQNAFKGSTVTERIEELTKYIWAED